MDRNIETEKVKFYKLSKWRKFVFLWKCSLGLAIIIGIVFFAIEKSLNIYNLAFRAWLLTAVALVMGVLSAFFIIGAILILWKAKKQFKKYNNLFAIIGTIGILSVGGIIGTYGLLIMNFESSFRPERVGYLDDKKVVIAENNWLDVSYYYFEYKNLFVRGDKILKIK
jgi:hypothetical protein